MDDIERAIDLVRVSHVGSCLRCKQPYVGDRICAASNFSLMCAYDEPKEKFWQTRAEFMKETDDLGGHESHGGRSDLEPVVPPELPHAGSKVERLKRALMRSVETIAEYPDHFRNEIESGIDLVVAAVRADERAKSAWQKIETAPKDESAILDPPMVGSGTPPLSAIKAFASLRVSCEEVMASHRDPHSADYNECEKAPCAWCEDVQKAINVLAVALLEVGCASVVNERSESSGFTPERSAKDQPEPASHVGESETETASDYETGFHWRDGLFFKRMPDESVRLCWKRHDEATPRLSVTIPENEWASIVASVSRNGETGHSWQFVRDFHNGGCKRD